MSNGQKAPKKPSSVTCALIASLFGIGYVPFAPATVASIACCVVIWFTFKHPLTYAIVALSLFAIGVWVSSKMEDSWGEDNRRIVIDEAVGIIITLFLVPHRILFFVIGFLLFRFFDIIKPYPINSAQYLPGGWGVMLDDVVASLYSNMTLWLFIIIFYRIL